MFPPANAPPEQLSSVPVSISRGAVRQVKRAKTWARLAYIEACQGAVASCSLLTCRTRAATVALGVRSVSDASPPRWTWYLR
ncbi:hypothetical protein LX32DRAFT_251847 [Colletotrichum zoysiae]|uniref:Uncharacterized protein n=1 Tax=Colletotrichum zoysiae TaxID=1216348 RepID=A0AAD9H2Y2_9PEZI|nr:hypothetical protein LX32DRAFT_251847 [Colletotrichum zoysiae]